MNECDPAEQRIILDKLSLLGTLLKGLRVFLTSRESLTAAFKLKFPATENILIASPAIVSNINTFIHEELEKQLLKKDLVVELKH